MKNVNEMVCGVCEHPLSVSDDIVLGSEISCGSCGSLFETYQVAGHGGFSGEVSFAEALPVQGMTQETKTLVMIGALGLCVVALVMVGYGKT